MPSAPDLIGTAIQLVPVLQLQAEDFPEVEFFPGTDLLQLLWCPLDHDEPIFVAKPFLFWRRMTEVTKPLVEIPRSEMASDWYLPRECKLNPERVIEYPPQLTEEMEERIFFRSNTHLTRDEIRRVIEGWNEWYSREHSTCPANKVGGFAHGIDYETPACDCGREMEYLLTLTDSEFDGANWQRWCPMEDRQFWESVALRVPFSPTAEENEAMQAIQDPARFFGFCGGRQHLFLCRRCSGWPIRSVFQR